VLETSQPLSEVDSWGLKRVYDVIEFLDMKKDYEKAMEGKRAKEYDDKNRGNKLR